MATDVLKSSGRKAGRMVLKREFRCPRCEQTRSFWKTARTTVHLGVKTKWRCSECEYGLVRIDGEVDSSVADA